MAIHHQCFTCFQFLATRAYLVLRIPGFNCVHAKIIRFVYQKLLME
jgi:hypothetical protein